ncbi:MAG: hypothetical protein R3B46_11065 [Phycisphaerales bacterium]
MDESMGGLSSDSQQTNHYALTSADLLWTNRDIIRVNAVVLGFQSTHSSTQRLVFFPLFGISHQRIAASAEATARTALRPRGPPHLPECGATNDSRLAANSMA